MGPRSSTSRASCSTMPGTRARRPERTDPPPSPGFQGLRPASSRAADSDLSSFVAPMARGPQIRVARNRRRERAPQAAAASRGFRDGRAAWALRPRTSSRGLLPVAALGRSRGAPRRRSASERACRRSRSVAALALRFARLSRSRVPGWLISRPLATSLVGVRRGRAPQIPASVDRRAAPLARGLVLMDHLVSCRCPAGAWCRRSAVGPRRVRVCRGTVARDAGCPAARRDARPRCGPPQHPTWSAAPRTKCPRNPATPRSDDCRARILRRPCPGARSA